MKNDKKISKRIRRLERKTPTSRSIIISASSGSGSGGGTGVTEFVELADVPSSYSGETLKVVRVNAGETGLEFATISGGGHTIEDEGTPLTTRTKLNFVGAGVTVTDDAGDDATVVTIPSSSITVSDTQVLFADGANNPSGEAAFTYNKTTNTLDVDKVTVDDDAYASGWNGSLEVPTKNAVYDKIETLTGLTADQEEMLELAYLRSIYYLTGI